jgi:hypothetical protein
MKKPLRTEFCSVIQAPGEGCAFCIDGAKSDSTASAIDICRETYSYLPLHLDTDNQRPSWCPGFERNGDGVAVDAVAHETSSCATTTEDSHETINEQHQEELAL